MSIEMAGDGQHWIGAGSNGVFLDGAKQPEHVNTYLSDETRTDVAISRDGSHWVAAGSRGVLLDGQWVSG
ncbi:MAG: hypothetical protein HY319_10330 [Armatimonadetes bacterium]|nr:hypothetical protein [Armatimonadota bacterium]